VPVAQLARRRRESRSRSAHSRRRARKGRYGIRANVISIGLTDTEQAREAFASWGEAATQKVIDAIPLKRIAQPEEIARMAAFLAGEDGAYVTGKVIQVDGGQMIAG